MSFFASTGEIGFNSLRGSRLAPITAVNSMTSYTLKFENGVERETSITYFITKALEDPEARVFDAETGDELTDIMDIDGNEAVVDEVSA